MKLLIMALGFVLFSFNLIAQEKNQYQFAQSYLGISTHYLGQIAPRNALEVSPHFDSRITIGGLHFWGKVDFHVSFPLYSRALNSQNGFGYSEGVKTGGRWLPFGLSAKSPRPYLGAEWTTPAVWTSAGPTLSKNAFNLEIGGIMVINKSFSIECGVHYNSAAQWNYPTSRISHNVLASPSFGLDFGFKKYIDFTAGLERESSQAFIKKTEAQMLAHKNLSGWSFATGVSSNIPLSKVRYLEQFNWLESKAPISIHIEYGLGYYFHKRDLALRLAYRPITKQSSAYGLKAKLHEKRVSLESFKFLFDYKGFVPFVGIGLDLINYQYSVNDGSMTLLDKTGSKVSSSLVFGWDIRPTQVEWFILRTNLRLSPLFSLNKTMSEFQSIDLEFNFIQFVLYPERLSYYFKK